MSNRLNCPICRTEITETQSSALCSACGAALHETCAGEVDYQCPTPGCRGSFVISRDGDQIIVSGPHAETPVLDTLRARGNVFSVRPFESEDRRSLRDWWHQIIRDHGRYACYAMLLALPSDREALRYLREFGKELDLISGKNCLLIALSSTEVRRSRFDEELWEVTVDEHVSEGYSLRVAKLFGIEFEVMPCLMLFKDIRSSDYVVVTLRGIDAEEISARIRSIFSIIQQAIAEKKNPIEAVEHQRNREKLWKTGQSIVSLIRNTAGKSFEIAVEAWIKAITKTS